MTTDPDELRAAAEVLRSERCEDDAVADWLDSFADSMGDGAADPTDAEEKAYGHGRQMAAYQVLQAIRPDLEDQGLIVLRKGGGAEAIAAERERQITEEGWTPEHDDAYGGDELILAARCYLVQAEYEVAGHGSQPIFWPWHKDWWKPGDRRRNLVKSGALIAAEIDRLDREATDD